MNHSIKSIESLGYGKGFTESAELFGRLLRMFDALQKKKMHVILLSHVGIRTFNDPEREPYDRWEMSTHKKVSAMIREWVDFNLFPSHDPLWCYPQINTTLSIKCCGIFMKQLTLAIRHCPGCFFKTLSTCTS